MRTAIADRYVLDRELGRGGMATVYLAEDRKYGRQVAIKVLRPDVAVSLGAERFLREVGIAARLSHPHIVPLIDSGETDGTLYYVASYVPGGSLRDRLQREGRLPVRDALRVAREAGSGLDFVHRSGYVHRDVKPDNILFADGQAVLADFGIALACSTAAGEALTDAGIAVGTPEYMSPEQASGERDLDSRSDIYSLACVVYEMLAGEPPFAGGGARAIMARQVTEPPRLIRELRPDTPVAVERALARALAKVPHERFATVPELIEALDSTSSGEARSVPARTRSIAVLPFVNASSDPENAFLSDGITDELIDVLAKVKGLRVASRTSVFALRDRPRDVREVGSLLGVTELIEGTVRRAGDQLRITAQLTCTGDGRVLWSQRYDRKLVDVLAIQDEIARTIVSALRAISFADLSAPPPRRRTSSVKAYGLYLRGRHAWNERTHDGIAEAIRWFEEAIVEDRGYAQAWAGLADCWALHVDYRNVPVQEGFERAKAYARTAIELDDASPEAHASLAWSLFIYDWDWAGAEREYRRAIELDPRYATAHQWYAFLLASHARFEESVAEALTALELDPASVSVRRSASWTHYYARRFAEAVEHAERAVAMNPTAEESYRVLGLALVHARELGEAERALREAVELPGAGAYATATLAWALVHAGKREEAEALVGALEAEAASGAYVSPVALAIPRIGLGHVDRALALAERAYEERRGWLAYLSVNPMVDPLRGDPRFDALIRRMRF